MMKLVVLFLFILSMNAFAGYECDVSLSTSSDPDEAIAFEIIKATDTELGSKNLSSYYSESDESTLDLVVFMDGWAGEEEIVISVNRSTSGSNEKISEKLSIRGEDQNEMWFDQYKLEASCYLTKGRKK